MSDIVEALWIRYQENDYSMPGKGVVNLDADPETIGRGGIPTRMTKEQFFEWFAE